MRTLKMTKLRSPRGLLLVLIFSYGSLGGVSNEANAYTANKVWFEFLTSNNYRIHVTYTVPPLREFREAYVEFTNRKDAESYYWDLARGADFYFGDPKERRFMNTPPKPQPW